MNRVSSLLLTGLLMTAGCGGNSDEPARTDFTESEPNDDYADSNELGGAGDYVLTGTLDEGEMDLFELNSGPGLFSVSVRLDLGGAGFASVWITDLGDGFGEGHAIEEADGMETETDAVLQLSYSIPTAQPIFVLMNEEEGRKLGPLHDHRAGFVALSAG